MGLKEFIRQTAENQPDNIRDIKIEPEKKMKKLPFDPETDITEADWQIMISKLEWYRQEEIWGDFSTLAAWMKTIRPDRAGELNLDDVAWQEMTKKLDEYYNLGRNVDWSIFLLQAQEMKALFPDRADKLSIDDDTWEKIKSELDNVSRYQFLRWVEQIRILWPEREREIDLSHIDWRTVIKEIESAGFKGEWQQYLVEAARMRVLCPERVWNSFSKNIPWRELKKFFLSARAQRDEWAIAYRAEAMMILAAHKVEITKNGLKITMRPQEDYKEEHKPRPVRLSLRGVPSSRS